MARYTTFILFSVLFGFFFSLQISALKIERKRAKDKCRDGTRRADDAQPRRFLSNGFIASAEKVSASSVKLDDEKTKDDAKLEQARGV